MKHIVIIGGGYAGVAALRKLSKLQNIKITLVDRHPYHFLQTQGYELVANTIPFDKTIINLRTFCKSFGNKVSFLHDVVEDIDLNKKIVQCNFKKNISYDYLIIATGSVTRFLDTFEKVKNCSHGVKSLTGAFRVKQFFEKELFLRLESEKETKKHYSVLIAGAGLSGVEIAAQMQEYFNRYFKSNTLACQTLKIHLVSGSKDILKKMHPKTITKSQKRLEELGVILHKGSHIAKVENDRAILQNSQVIPFDFMIFTGGIKASPIVDKIDTPKNRLNQIIVKPTLQLQNHQEVYAIGDSAQLCDKKERLLPPTAHIAIQSGKVAAKNITLMLKGKPPKIANLKQEGIAIALGGKYAIIEIGNFQISSIWAYFGKKTIEKLYKLPLLFRCRSIDKIECSCNHTNQNLI